MVTFSQLGNYGYLGNQLFQIATTYALALDNNTEAQFPKWEYQKYFQTQLPELNFTPKAKWTEPGFSHYTIKYSEDIDLFGYFQSEKYFKHRRKEILDLFQPIKKIKDLVKSANLKKHCSLHIRRGDYLNLSHTHPQLSSEYIKTSQSLSSLPLAVFSDDIDWCKKNIEADMYIENDDPVESLFLMSSCKHNIIANSSFSWWAAWLGNAERVFAPRMWFGPSGPSTWKDIYCDGWILI